MAAADWVVESFERQSTMAKWRNVEKDADLIAQATACLKTTSNTLKVSSSLKIYRVLPHLLEPIVLGSRQRLLPNSGCQDERRHAQQE